MMESEDYYRVLGVDKSDGQSRIREAYRQLALKYHPDRNKDNPDATEKMKAVNEAYAVLSNSQKRSEYDILMNRYGQEASRHFRQTYSEQDIFRNTDIQHIFEEISHMFGFRNFEEIFKEQYGQAYRQYEIKKPGVFAKGYVFSFPPGRKTGYSASPKGGSPGRVLKFFLKKAAGIELPERGKDIHDVIHLSPERARLGGPHLYHHVKRSKKLMVQIPAGIENGQKIHLAGMGDEGKGGAGPGDLFLEVKIHTSLTRRLKNGVLRLIGRLTSLFLVILFFQG